MELLTNDGSGVPSWGARINTSRREPRRQDQAPESYPEWAKPYDVWNWQHYGVVVWDDALQRMEVVSFIEAVKLLDQLRSADAWKSDGIAITRKTSYLKQPEQPAAPRSRKKRARSAPETSTQKSEMVTIDEERIRLRGQAAVDFYALLEANEAQIRRLAEEDERQMREALNRAYALIFRWSHEQEAKELNIAARPLPWCYDEQPLTWTCDLPPNRGTVSLTKNNWFWQGCIEQPDRFKHESAWFGKLEEALAWAEQELITIQQEAESATSTDEAAPRPRDCRWQQWRRSIANA